MRILTLTTLYPNAAAPMHGVFVENRLRAFTKESGADVRVVAPVPFFPFRASLFGRYAAFARAPQSEERYGIRIDHPRYFIPPKLGMTFAARALEECFLRAARRLIDERWDFDLIDAHYYYPDGVAAVRAAQTLGKPVVVTARGSDVTLYPEYKRQRKMILNAARKADATIAVADALKEEMIRLGAADEKITTLRNGVDLNMFRPLDRLELRQRMNLAGTVIASVGHLIERKGHHLVIEALKAFPNATLLIAGEGEARGALEARARSLGVNERVRFLGAVPHERLAEIYNAADVLALASSREGWPNVLLEAMACGTPCAAAPAGGSGEVVGANGPSRLAAARTAPAMAEAMAALLRYPPAREDVRAYAAAHSWEETARGVTALFSRVIEDRRRAAAVATRPLRLEDKVAPKLIVTVDAEEEFDWNRMDCNEHKVAKPAALDRFQMLCEAVGAKPLYFITYPLLQDAETVEYFRALRLSRTADAGVHMHAWATPPNTAFSSDYCSFQTNLPVGVHRRKFEALAAQFETVFGERPRAHRAGRYGLRVRDYPLLRAAGIDFDFSPGAAFDFSAAGGPDFTDLSNHPYSVECESSRRLFAFPVSGARALRGTRMFFSQENGGRLRLRRATAPVRLSPEGASFEDLKSLAKRLIRDGVPVLTFTLHSSSLTPGANAYAPDNAAVDRMLETTQAFFNWFAREKNGAFISLKDLTRACGADAPVSDHDLNLNRPLSRVA